MDDSHDEEAELAATTVSTHEHNNPGTIDEGNESEDQDDENEDDDHDDDDEDEVEPTLKYQRVRGTLSTIFEEAGLRITCLGLHADIILVGTSRGTVFELRHDGMLIRRNQYHRGRVTSIALDAAGEAFASSGVDGRVAVGPTSRAKDEVNKLSFEKHKFSQPILAVALDPEYARNRDKMFVCGGAAGRLVLKRKGWFSSVETELHRGEGQITAIKWRTRLIAWANEAGVKIYDQAHEKRIAFIDRPSGSLTARDARCHMVWENDSTLLIAWADSVKVVRIFERSKEEMQADPNQLPRYAELISLYEFAHVETICGISPFGRDQLALLTFLDDRSTHDGPDAGNDGNDDQGSAPPVAECPELRVIARADGEPVSMEALPIRGYENNTAPDYALATAHELHGAAGIPTLFILSPRDLVSARPRILEDHIAYALQHRRYAVALSLAESAGPGQLQAYSLRGLQDKLLGFLLSEHQYNQAASLCPRLLNSDPDRWLQWASKFESLEHLRSLAGYLPVRNPQLPAIVYESVIEELLRVRDDEALLHIIRQWVELLSNHARALSFLRRDRLAPSPRTADHTDKPRAAPLFDVRKAIERVNAVIESDFDGAPPALRDALAELYVMNGQYTAALHQYLEASAQENDAAEDDLQRAEIIFSLIERHGLAPSAVDHVPVLVALDERRAVSLLVELVTSEFGADESTASATADLVGLIHRPADLLEFLESANHYSLQEALHVCESRRAGPLYKEMVYILGRTGSYENVQRALAIILENLRDVPFAIRFVESEGGAGLWGDLVRRCVRDPALVGRLLESAGAHDVDLVQIFREMPADLVVPGLSTKLPKLFEDIRIQQRIRHTCNDILRQDAVELFRALHRRRKRAVLLRGGARCEICKLPLAAHVNRAPGASFSPEAPSTPRIVVFGSGQAYHYGCLDVASQATIPVSQQSASTKSRHIQVFAAAVADDARSSQGSDPGA
ncbi:Vacuolar protein sorting-associated protein 41-like [Hondaea fermentalgiana]|uniref:Vacuolar protein sorting-associated protein 41-like n=1 Tax=Hondaea fermentalgiana TaxID=2315210 RepID=A0A2R5GXY9_9STRA|nr:Vacuolar protein sorting-associated protein 41-like [Hondaea fermentalgiana]|eukprot:GBG33583.1 Vacuolar protein sorting-associated protein 41-like [Hondaea fermentalgiana]